jgi:1,4-alpha-glucan branching enzyme
MSKHHQHHDKQIPGIRPQSKTIEVHFSIERPTAEHVYVSGEFNGWSPASARMVRRDGNCLWEKRLTLPPGRYEYKFVVDGEWVVDPMANEHTVNAFGSLNSILEVP